MTVALVFAGGSGLRMRSAVPKQFLDLGGKPVMLRTMELFQEHPRIDGIYVVAHGDFLEETKQLVCKGEITKFIGITAGGATAMDSIFNGLKGLACKVPLDTIVLIHDGVRPYVAPHVITANIESVRLYGSAVTYVNCFETILLSNDGSAIDSIPRRTGSYVAQAPQSFRLGEILELHEMIRATGTGYADIVDQATLCHKLGKSVHLVKGNRGNVKVTTPEDLVALNALIEWRKANG